MLTTLALSACLAFQDGLQEVRGVWITTAASDVLSSRAKIADAMEFLANSGLDVVFPVVWSRGRTLYPSAVMKAAFGEDREPAFEGRDVLAQIVFEAHRQGLEVIPWFEYGFVSSHQESGGAILKKRPEWTARGRDGKPVSKDGFDWMNALDPEVQGFVQSLVLEVCRSYDVDGVQGDDRLPALPCEAGYDPRTVERYRKETGRDPPADPKDPKWVQWRADILTTFLARLRKEVKAVSPDLVVAMAPNAGEFGLREFLQDAKAWVEQDLVDVLIPQVYRRDAAAYRKELEPIARAPWLEKHRGRVAPGVLVKLGDWRATPELLLAEIAANRELGLGGESLFFYEGLHDRDGELAKALRDVPYAEDARLPWRGGRAWRPRAKTVDPVAGAGQWNWNTREGEPIALELDGSEAGHVTWTFVPPQTGTYDIYVWISPPAVVGNRAPFRIASAGGMRTVVIDPSQPRNKDWVLLGQVQLEEKKSIEIARLIAEEPDATKTTTAGPIVALIDRRIRRR